MPITTDQAVNVLSVKPFAVQPVIEKVLVGLEMLGSDEYFSSLGEKENNFEFKIQTKAPSGRILVGHRTFKDSFYSRHLHMDIYSLDTDQKIYQGKADSDGKIKSLPYVINGLAYALFNDFPGINSVLYTYEIGEDIYNPEAYLQRQNNKFLKIQDRKTRNW